MSLSSEASNCIAMEVKDCGCGLDTGAWSQRHLQDNQPRQITATCTPANDVVSGRQKYVAMEEDFLPGIHDAIIAISLALAVIDVGKDGLMGVWSTEPPNW